MTKKRGKSFKGKLSSVLVLKLTDILLEKFSRLLDERVGSLKAGGIQHVGES